MTYKIYSLTFSIIMIMLIGCESEEKSEPTEPEPTKRCKSCTKINGLFPNNPVTVCDEDEVKNLENNFWICI